MAIFKSVQLTEGFRKYPIDEHGKLRYLWGTYVAPAALAAADQIELFRLPPGRKRILPWQSRVWTSAYGAARTLSLGHREYTKQSSPLTSEAESANALLNALDVSAAVNNGVLSANVPKYDIYSREEVVLFATIAGGTLPQNGTLTIALAYLYE